MYAEANSTTTAAATNPRHNTFTNIPKWNMSGDWFDICSCHIHCPCTFAQSPSNEMCEGIVRSMTPPSKRVQPLMPPEVRWVQVGLQHGERQLQMKYMFLNLALHGSEVESPVNMSHSTGQNLEDPRL